MGERSHVVDDDGRTRMVVEKGLFVMAYQFGHDRTGKISARPFYLQKIENGKMVFFSMTTDSVRRHVANPTQSWAYEKATPIELWAFERPASASYVNCGNRYTLDISNIRGISNLKSHSLPASFVERIEQRIEDIVSQQLITDVSVSPHSVVSLNHVLHYRNPPNEDHGNH